MSELLIDQRNLAFELYEVLDAEALTQRPRFADHNRETFDAAIGTARTIAEKPLVVMSHVDLVTQEDHKAASLGDIA